MSHPPLDRILSKLKKKKNQGEGYLACCPAHDDQTPSLSVTPKPDGSVLVFCHAGCKTEDVLAAVGLKFHDLFNQKILYASN